MINNHWTAEDDAVLRELYPGSHPLADLAVRLGRSVPALFNRAQKLGLHGTRKFKHPAEWPAEIVTRVRALHAEGLTDPQIAVRMADVFRPGEDGRLQARNLRKRLGLPMNVEGVNEARRRGVRTQYAKLGISCGGELRSLGYRQFAARQGWPDDLPPRCVQILNLLCEHGPMTARELAGHMGLDVSGRTCAQLLKCSAHSKLSKGHGTYTGVLLARGLIATQRRYTSGRGKGKNILPNVYFVTADTIALREAHLERIEREGQRGIATGEASVSADATR